MRRGTLVGGSYEDVRLANSSADDGPVPEYETAAIYVRNTRVR